MTGQRKINLNPEPDRLEVIKITYPHTGFRRTWQLLPMRFIPHDGRASA